MKKLILIILFFNSPFVRAVNYTVTACSFIDSAIVQYNSAQWVDVKVSGSYTTSDRIKIHLTQMVGSTTTGTYTAIFDQPFFSYFLGLPQQADGSRRVYFNMPASYPTGKFQLSIYGELYTLRYGFFYTATGLNEFINNDLKIINTKYYDLNGKQLIDEPYNEIYIIENFYSNNSYKRKKTIKQLNN